MSYYYTFGPFTVPRKIVKGNRRVLDDSKGAKNAFWKNVDQNEPGLATARGCYIFGVRTSNGIIPWYVGQSKTGFKKECFTPQKVNHYHNVVNDTKKGTPILILLARYTSGNRMSKTISLDEANFVEKYIISLSLERNSSLRNTNNTRFLRNLQIPGALNNPAGRPSTGATLLKRTLGV